MANKMHVEQHFECSAKSLYDLLTDEDFDKKLMKAVEVGREVLEHEKRDGGSFTKLKLSPSTKLPGFMKKLIGGANSYVEHRTWTDATLSNTWIIEPGMSPDKVDIKGTVVIKDNGDGTCTRVIDGDFSVKIALIGGKVEKFIIGQTQESFVKSTAWIAKYIADNDID